MTGRLVRAIVPDAPAVRILVDGEEVTAYADESVLVAVLAARNALRQHEFSDEMRAGFCLMGACQDCWVRDVSDVSDGADAANAARVRACSTPVRDGMAIVTRAIDPSWPRQPQP